ncbi:MAG TPA: hypothetical protein VK335_02310 [Bryobacteraceae bacterium]|nr:hypothetical protein [Bryobacteraceae bacterium]
MLFEVCAHLPFRLAAVVWLAVSLSLISAPVVDAADVLTYHNDIGRTGQNLNEPTLTPSNVKSSTFGRLFTISVDGKVDAQPLYVSSVAISGQGTHNLLIAATEHGSVYAFDADTGSQIWKVSTLKSGESTSDDRGCSQVTPEIGVTATPAIDRTRGPNGAIYLVAMSKDGSGNYFQRLHALDLTTGAELFGGPTTVQATYPGTGDNSSNGIVTFDAKQYKERPGLLLLNGLVYTAWGSHCDAQPYTGWVMGYDAGTLAQTTVLNVVPNGGEGGIWMAGAGIASDSSGNIYVLDGNGDFDTTLSSNGFPANGNFGNAFLKISTSGGLGVADYFEMNNEAQENGSDTDLGSGGALVLPDQTDNTGKAWHLAVGAGKDGNLYLVNRDSMGQFTSNNGNIYQELAGALPGGIWAMPAYFNGRIYYGPVGSPIFAFQFSNAKLLTSATAQTSNSFGYPGAIPSISANNTSNGIVWAAESTNPAVLHAYDAGTLLELYNSNQAASSRDHFGAGNKFIAPMITNGKVYVGTTSSVGVFGLLTPPPSPPTSLSAGSVGGGIQSCDVNNDGNVNVQDVQLAINMDLGLLSCTLNIDGAGTCNVIAVQRIINADLGQPCVTGPGVTAHSVSLSWTASTSPNVAGYNVYRGTTAAGPYTKVNSTVVAGTTYTDATAQPSQTYYYVLTAVDSSNNESPFSASPSQSVLPSS